jgi:ATPase subunit of ABC transporter with duplicated ATPase domains
MATGGRLRTGQACVFARSQPPFLLLLDEPARHPDLASVEELEDAMKGYDGALVVISDDETFLRTIGTEREIAL